MIDPDLIQAQVSSLALFKVVGGAAEVTALVGTGQALGDGPNAYVIPTTDDPQAPKAPGGPQVVTVTFGVLMMLRRFGDASGSAGMSKISVLQKQLHRGLVGWKPPGHQPCYWRSARLLHFDKAALWWLEEFSAVGGLVPTIQS